MFIALDGMDGAGKSTQHRLMCDWLISLGRDVVTYRDPGSTPLGETVREILLHREDIPLALTAEMLLYMAARAQLVEECLLPALRSNKIVVADRFLLANVVYQGSAGGLDPTTIWEVGKIATQGLRPDATIVIDVPVEVALSRLGSKQDRLEKRGQAYFERVRQGFLDQVGLASDRTIVIDGTQEPTTVFSQIKDFLCDSLSLS